MPAPTVKPFLQPFGSLGPMDFATLFLSLALGTAALPSLLMRSGVTSSIADQRRSTAWGLLFVALFVMTAPAIATFAKLIVFRDISLASASSLPPWLTELADKTCCRPPMPMATARSARRSCSWPRRHCPRAAVGGGLPYVLCVLMATAALAIAVAAAAAHLFTLAASLAEDLYRVLDRGQALPRLIAAWAAIAASSLAVAMFLMIAEVDPLKAALTAFAFAGASFFPALLLAIWWRRCTKWGAFAAMTGGFLAMLGELVVGGMLGISNAGFTTSLASLIGALLALVAGVAVSLYLHKPSQGEDNYYEEMRDPEGEAIYDRAQARAAAQAAAQASAAAETAPSQ